jgi:hypothetical protein
MARFVGAAFALVWSVALSLIAAAVPMGGASEVVNGKERDVTLTFLDSQGSGVWLSLSIIGIAIPLMMIVVPTIVIRQVVFALAATGTLLATASVGVFYAPWLIAMIPAIINTADTAILAEKL